MTPSVRVGGIVIDVTDLDRMAAFWSELLGLDVSRRESAWISLGPTLALQLVPESKAVKNRLHLDLVAADWPAATKHAFELGGKPVSEIRENLWQVWQDPEGNEFCLCKS